jgi:very-short-patch-repair endonuclease
MDEEPRSGRGGRDAIEVVHGRRRGRLVTMIASQHGHITHAQLLAAGIGRGAIEHRTRTGRLTVVHRGVYAVGPAVAPRGPEMAAVLACKPDAYVSHESSVHLHGLFPIRAQPDPVHVTVLRRRPGPRTGIAIHRTERLESDETAEVENIPATTVARAILDLAATLDTPGLEQLVAEAYAANLTSRHKLQGLVRRYPGRPGTPALAALLETAPKRTRSRPERMLLALIRKAGLHEPRVNARLHGYEVDFLWPEHRLVVEFDSHAFHASRPKRERDSRRDQDLGLRGFLILRVTWYQLTREPEALIARIATALAQREPSSRSTTDQ